MATKAENEAGIETGTEARRDDEGVRLDKAPGTSATGEAARAAAEDTGDTGDSGRTGDTAETGHTGDGDERVASAADTSAVDTTAVDTTAADAGPGAALGAAAVVSAGLGVISLTGSWVGTVAQARESLYGQLETVQGAPVATQIEQVYADSWNANALVAGLFALVALIVGVVVLVRPAFGNPDRIPAQAPWVRSVAWAGVSLGVVGLLLAALKYSDVLLGVPSAG